MKIRLKLFSIWIMILFISVSLSAQTNNWELNYLHKLEDKRTTGKTSFYNTISASMYVFSIATPAAYLVTGLAKNDVNLKKTALYLFESAAIAQAISFSTKSITNRDRPGIKDPTLKPVNIAKNASFPSGHTAGAFALATSLTIVHPKWYVAVPAYTWAGLVGYSRLYLGVHYPTDVFAGAVLGAGAAWGTYKLNKWMHKSKKGKLKDPLS